MTEVDLTGAADLHCHFGPDTSQDRAVDALGAARAAAEHGHAAIVLKSHTTPTASVAHVVDQVVPGVAVFGGICCNYEVGGVNPAAVETALRLGAKIVWLPTLSSRQDQRNGAAAQAGVPGPGICLVGESGDVTAPTATVIDLVVEHGAILGTGHVGFDEHMAVVRAVGGRATVLVTHAREQLAGANLTEPQCVELARQGAFVEFCAMTAVGSLASRTVDELATCIAAVGPERCTLATDFGLAGNPTPAEGLARFAGALVDAGFSTDDVRRMACQNPCALVGL